MISIIHGRIPFFLELPEDVFDIVLLVDRTVKDAVKLRSC